LTRPRPGLALPLVAALVAGGITWLAYRIPGTSSDLDQLLDAARALAGGHDPYRVIAQRYPFPLFYPLTAPLIVAPLALLPNDLARCLFAAITAGLLAWLTRPPLRIALLSASFANALVLNQWSPLLVLGAVVPALGCLWAVKPTIGAALFAAYPSKRAAVGGVALVGVALAFMPAWPLEWWRNAHTAFYIPPVMRPGGFLLLLALLRWRDPRGRLLAALALVPQSSALYETMPLFLLPRRRWEAYALAILTYVVAFSQAIWFPVHSDGPTAGVLHASLDERWPLVFALVWLPSLGLVLRNKEAGPPTTPDEVEGRAHPSSG
jgi:hypothetical protein